MAATLNKVILVGNVGRDPEIRLTQDGKEIANFSLATSDVWRDKVTGERREKTEWHKIVVFVPQLVDIAKKYLRKGKRVYIEGSLQTRKWMDQTNAEKYITEILLQSYNSTLMMLDPKSNDEHDNGNGQSGSSGTSKNNSSSIDNSKNNSGGSGSNSQRNNENNGSKRAIQFENLDDDMEDDDIPF